MRASLWPIIAHAIGERHAQFVRQRGVGSTEAVPRQPRHAEQFANRLQAPAHDVVLVNWLAGSGGEHRIVGSGEIFCAPLSSRERL